MKVVELLKLGQNLLETMQENCIKLRDVRYISLYEEYMEMKINNLKISYIITFLSEKHKISERKVYYLLKKFDEDCKIDAVQ